MNKLIIGITVAIVNYMLLFILSIIIHSKVEVEFIGMWGLILGFMMLVGALPLHRITYFGGRGIMGSHTPEIPPDEHLHHQVQHQHEQENRNEINKNKKFHDILTVAGMTTILISIFIV